MAPGPDTKESKRLERLESLKNGRSVICSQLDRVKLFVDSIDKDTTLQQLELRLSSIDSAFSSFDEIQGKIEDMDADESKDPEGIRAKYEELYYNAQPELSAQIKALKPIPDQVDSVQKTNIQHLKLPLPQLPLFSGEITKWLDFYETFKSLVHSHPSLSKTAKFQYLKSTLTGNALRAIETIEISDKNYDVALEVLINRYQNKRIICSEHLQRIFDAPSLPKPSASALRELLDEFNSHVRALASLGRPVDKWDDVLIHLMSSKLDPMTRNKWLEECPVDKLPTLSEFTNFLVKRCQVLECCSNSSSSQPCKNNLLHINKKSNPKSLALTKSEDKAIRKCLYCSGLGHFITRCYKFIRLPVNEKCSIAQSKQLCNNCLRDDHETKNCQLPTCRKCNGSHHSLLHPNENNMHRSNLNNLNPNADEFRSQPAQNSTVLQISSDINSTSQRCSKYKMTILATAVVNVLDKNNTPIPCRILLDSGSQINLITERLSQLLGVRKQGVTTSICGIGTYTTVCKFKTSLLIKSRFNEFSYSLEANVIKKITQQLPECNIDITKWSIPGNINLADPLFQEPRHVDILLGASHFFSILSIGQIRLSDDLPVLQNTVFGWIVSGVLKTNSRNSSQTTCNVCVQEEENLNEILQSFSRVESISESPGKGIIGPCETHFRENCKRLADGHFQVRLPFKKEPSSLGSSYEIALKRFYSLEKRIQKDPAVTADYIKFMREYADLGHMQIVKTVNFKEPHFFMPHHCIVKPGSSTTKLRVVFDASCKTSSGISLNEIMHVGPLLQPDLFSTAIKFRYHKFVFTADLTKMYRQVSMHEDDQQFQYIIWRESPLDELKVFKLCTVTYGTSAASYLAIRVLYQLAAEEGDRYPVGAEILRNDFYVDDVLTGSDSFDDVMRMKEELQLILLKGGFQLRKWCSNDKRIIEDIPVSDREEFFQLRQDNVIKTLGLIWEPSSDKFQIMVNLQPLNRFTKRSVLSDIAKLYDPLGLINPVIVKAKIFMQVLWKSKLDWDEALPQELHYAWKSFRHELLDLDKISIVRHVLGCSRQKTELHAFSDSSEKAYGACVYVRSVDKHGSVVVNLLCAKSKVAPIDKHRITLPRLELCAATMMVNLVDKIINIEKQRFSTCYYWTDSSIVLHWISSDHHEWPTFISNRVAVIQSLSNINMWRHISSNNNPADVVSRGCSPHELSGNALWFSGPSFLIRDEETWPVRVPDSYNSDEVLERKAQRIVLVAAEEDGFIENLKYKNSYMKTIRTIAYMLRFEYNGLSKMKMRIKRKGNLCAAEIEEATLCVVGLIQRQFYSEEIKALGKCQNIAPKSHISSLAPFLDDKGILRVGGRLHCADATFEFKHPILLPAGSTVTAALLRYYHEKHHHLGTQGLVAVVRQKYWPVHGKTLAKRIIRQCVSCFKANPKPSYPIMANLPHERINPSRPFSITGTDFCGPFLVHYKRRGSVPTKAYVAVFVCFSTKAVHLELVSDLTTAAFLGALRRFFSRRGLSSIIYSDNATNYIGARNELREMYELLRSKECNTAIRNWLSEEGIEWRTIPPRSPHFGGIWEAAVKMAKYHMKRLLHLASLTYEELNTVIIEIEAILNSRPLSPLSEDPSDFQPLTPGHFLVGSHLQIIPDPDISDKNLTYLSRWQRVQWIMQQFWCRWKNEYLQCLQQRKKWRHKNKRVEVGDVVIINDDNLPPLQWRLGRVSELHKGADGTARVATVKTANGTFKRAIAKLCSLPKVEDIKSLQGGENVSAIRPDNLNADCTV